MPSGSGSAEELVMVSFHVQLQGTLMYIGNTELKDRLYRDSCETLVVVVGRTSSGWRTVAEHCEVVCCRLTQAPTTYDLLARSSSCVLVRIWSGYFPWDVANMLGILLRFVARGV